MSDTPLDDAALARLETEGGDVTAAVAELRRLRADNARLNGHCERYVEDNLIVTQENLRLRAEAEALREDSARMSLLEQWLLLCSFGEPATLRYINDELRCDFDGASILTRGPNLRAAIDAARKRGEK